jgi:hypothetical protein
MPSNAWHGSKFKGVITSLESHQIQMKRFKVDFPLYINN